METVIMKEAGEKFGELLGGVISSGRTDTSASKVPTEYGLDAANFVLLWETAKSIDEAAASMAAFCVKHGYPPIPKARVISRAAKYRAEGGKLQKFRGGMRPVDQKVAEMNAQIDTIRQARQEGRPIAPAPVPPRPAPPGTDHEAVLLQIRGLLARLSAPRVA